MSSLLAYTTVFILFVSPPTSFSCLAPLFFGHIAFAICFGSLFAKTFRVWIVYKRVKNLDLSDHSDISDIHLIVWVSCYTLIYVIYLVVFAVSDPVLPVQKVLSPTDLTIGIACEPKANNWFIPIYIFEVCILHHSLI